MTSRKVVRALSAILVMLALVPLASVSTADAAEDCCDAECLADLATARRSG